MSACVLAVSNKGAGCGARSGAVAGDGVGLSMVGKFRWHMRSVSSFHSVVNARASFGL